MTNKYYFFIFVFLFGFSSMPVFAQTPEGNADKVLSMLSKRTQLYYEAQIEWYTDQEKKASDSLVYIYHKNGKQLYLRFGTVEMLNLDGTTVGADQDNRMVTIARKKAETPLDNLVDPTALRTALAENKISVQESNIGMHTRGLNFSDPEHPNNLLFIRYNTDSGFPEEIRLTGLNPFPNDPSEQKQTVTIVVRYRNIQINGRKFSHKLSDFVQKNGNNYEATGKYKGFGVISGS